MTEPTRERLSFVVPGRAVGKQRPRVTKGRTYTPKQTVEYERRIALAAKAASVPFCSLVSWPVEVRVVVKYETPKSWPAARRIALATESRPKDTKPDADNILKCVLDALRGVVYRDDDQVWKASIEKVWGYRDETRVELWW